jgi:hypothetical protein
MRSSRVPLVRLAMIGALAALLVLSVATPASAHVEKDVGSYHFVVGWGTEPTFAGQLNSVLLVLTHKATGRPVLDVGGDFKVTVTYGDQNMTLALEPTYDPDTGFGTPGEFKATLIPTAPGDYTFRFTGKVGAQTVDESFTSSPTTFDTVQDPASIQFPVKAPSTAEVAQRLDAELPRLATADQASSARTLSMVALVVGALGLALAGVAIARRRT